MPPGESLYPMGKSGGEQMRPLHPRDMQAAPLGSDSLPCRA